ncbi:bifunctional lysylphosphatidylglycerol flippase/synthetase MprF [Paenirhodobacter sp. CAU 1674]|uniref:bifunctional lysylphosphatidylglycerol flippase/synthetase MprF n=1 Tax=Paenirhodobacter sp. CAU 1674 TaxID=3032596 RepID=UPI0023DB5E0B|nr:bifunctional lysylphosphatidylglycerol flippase/synthetase MprF [Paenirhodobacter sp. CAU 1674]MDF2140167.1 bifunctional lysylphosphatidylglycerol flippase/synthetase MprF [Paenirhodobacter sp. CAU 1674]
MPQSPSSATPRTARLRNLLPIGLGLGLFAVGLWALYRLLKPVHAADILLQIKTMPPSALAIAMAATALGYMALIGYDWWALTYLEKRLPLRAVALGGFLGYAFGNTIGISVISGGAVRYRIYSAFGLNAFDVAALASYIALAMGMGLTLVGLFALGLHPAALHGLLPLPQSLIRLGAFGAGGGTLALLFWLSASRRSLKIWRYDITMPAPRILVGQLVVALFDSTMAALTLYILLPEGAPGFTTFLAIYATATMVGVLSHVPGGVGVFETVVLAAMPPGIAVGDVAAALLMFRSIYYLLPFAIAFVIVSLNEARLAGGWAARVFGELSEPMRPVMGALGGAAPWLTGLWALGFGGYLLLVALMPSAIPTGDSDDLVGAILLEGGTLVSAVMGIVLMILSHGLMRRLSGAFWLTIVALGGGVIAALMNNFDIESALLLTLGALALLPFRHEFHRHAKITEGVFTPAWFAMVAAVVLAAGSFFFFVHEATPYSQAFWTEFTHDANTPRAFRAALAASAVLLTFTVYLALQPSRARSGAPCEESLALAAQIIAAQNEPQACLALTGDKSFQFSPDQRAFVMYGRQRANWVALGDPVGPASSGVEAAWAFHEEALRAGGRAIFYEVSARHLTLWVEMGLALHKVGEEAVIALPGFSLAGGAFKTMRAAYNKAQREGLALQLLHPPHSETLLAELGTISQEWLAAKAGREKRFSVGHFHADYLAHFPIAVLRQHDPEMPGAPAPILAFANIMAPGNGTRVAIDLMRYRPGRGSGLMEFLFLALIEHYRDAGAAEFSLGVAPLAGLSERRTARLWDRFGHLMFRHGGAFYNFEGLRGFKQKFRPDWQPRFIALPPGVSPMMAMADVALLIAGGPRGILGKTPPRATPPESETAARDTAAVPALPDGGERR